MLTQSQTSPPSVHEQIWQLSCSTPEDSNVRQILNLSPELPRVSLSPSSVLYSSSCHRAIWPFVCAVWSNSCPSSVTQICPWERGNAASATGTSSVHQSVLFYGEKKAQCINMQRFKPFQCAWRWNLYLRDKVHQRCEEWKDKRSYVYYIYCIKNRSLSWWFTLLVQVTTTLHCNPSDWLLFSSFSCLELLMPLCTDPGPA